MHRARLWVVFAGFALVLALGGGLFLALSGYGTSAAHAQTAATPTTSSGIRTIITGTITATVTGTAEPAMAPPITATAPVTTMPQVTSTIAITGSATATPTVRTPSVVTGTVPASVTRSITVVGEGTVNIQPDTASTVIGVEVVTDTVKAGTAAVSETMGTILTALEAQGIPAKDIQTSGYSITVERTPVPTQPGSAATTEQVRYRVSNNVNVIIRDLNKIGSVLDAAVNAGANNVYGVNFSLTNESAVDHEAYTMAMNDADARAAYLAGLAGVELGPVISVSEIISQPGLPFYSRAAVGMGGGGGPIAPGELQVMRQLQVVYSIHDLPASQ